ncbi:C1 family peptidase, partial [Robinsoniella sp.]|uniref:C1 family peptidase n=1 Tax=Robinsoniella sp. TaxID=2496533 RepID=UPI0037533DBF
MLKKKAIIFWGILIILFQFPVTVYASQNVDRGVDYIKGRPLTEAEIQAQREMEPELKELAPYNIPESESSAAPRARMALPTAYDSRNRGYITSVKDQNPWGACWAFAFQGTLGASLIKDGWSAGLDLSEQHLGYFTYYRTADLFGNTAGDQVQIYLRQNVDKGYLDFGGNAQWAVMAMSSWTGAADESVSVYPRTSASMRPLNNAVAYQDIVHL